MPDIKVSTGPFKDIIFKGHADAAAYDTQAGLAGACVEAADVNDIYRSGLPAAHAKFIPILVAAGFTRGVNADATAKAKEKAKDPSKVDDVPEAAVTYFNRVKALLDAEGEDGKAKWAEIDAAVHAIELECDSSPSARQKGPDKGSLAKADAILARDDAAMETTVTKLLDVATGFVLDRDADGKPDRTSLARLITEYVNLSL